MKRRCGAGERGADGAAVTGQSQRRERPPEDGGTETEPSGEVTRNGGMGQRRAVGEDERRGVKHASPLHPDQYSSETLNARRPPGVS